MTTAGGTSEPRSTARRSTDEQTTDKQSIEQRTTRQRSPGRRATAGWPIPERSLHSAVLGVPPVVAISLAAGFTTLGVLIDILRIGTVGGIFTSCYFTGCALAVCWVRRRAIFGPMVTPPLLLAVAIPAVVLLAAPPRPGTGIAERLLLIGAPLVNAFPTMAVTTGVVLTIGMGRTLLQRIGSSEMRARAGGRRTV